MGYYRNQFENQQTGFDSRTTQANWDVKKTRLLRNLVSCKIKENREEDAHRCKEVQLSGVQSLHSSRNINRPTSLSLWACSFNALVVFSTKTLIVDYKIEDQDNWINSRANTRDFTREDSSQSKCWKILTCKETILL